MCTRVDSRPVVKTDARDGARLAAEPSLSRDEPGQRVSLEHCSRAVAQEVHVRIAHTRLDLDRFQDVGDTVGWIEPHVSTIALPRIAGAIEQILHFVPAAGIQPKMRERHGDPSMLHGADRGL
jgi:hypothetical protein